MGYPTLWALSAVALLVPAPALAGSELSPVTFIREVISDEGTGRLRLRIDNHPAFQNFRPNFACSPATFVDLPLDSGDWSEAEQSLLLDAVYVAFLINRNARFYICDDVCSTTATTGVRVVSGIQVLD